MPLTLLITPPNLPDVPMQRDAELLEGPLLHPILHFYSWSVPSLTYGYFANPHRLLHQEKLAVHGLHTAKRPTGGGVIFHLSDLTFSLLLPKEHPKVDLSPDANYASVHAIVLETLRKFLANRYPKEQFSLMQPQKKIQEEGSFLRPTFCMAQISRYDLILGGKKVGGAAQRQTQKGLLHQCSLYLTNPPFAMLEEVMQQGKRIVEQMQEESVPLLGSFLPQAELELACLQLRQCLYETMKDVF